MKNNYLDKIYNLKNKNVVIIGAGGHICSKLSEGFYSCGCNIALLDIRYKKLQIVKESIYSKGDSSIELFKMDACLI